MTLEIILVFSILLLTVFLFALEVFPVDKIAFLLIVVLVLFKLVSPEEAISGFSNRATIAILALMILAIAMEENGVIQWLTSGLGKLKGLPLVLLVPIFMAVTASISAFISTTAVVIVFIKIVNQLSEQYKIPASKLLLPISFAGILGGSCTLMGTSTNLLVNSVARNLGAERLGFFEFSFLGLIFLAVSIVYITLSLRWLPWGQKTDLSEAYEIEKYITSIQIPAGSKWVGKTIEETFLYRDPEISLLKLIRDNNVNNDPGKYITLKAQDELLITCDLKNLSRLHESEDFIVNEGRYPLSDTIPDEKGELLKTDAEPRIFVELLMLPGALFLGRTLRDLRHLMLHDAIPIAIKKRKTLRNLSDRLIRSSADNMVLKPGDRLLVEINREDIPTLKTMENIMVMQEHGAVSDISSFRKYFSLAVLLGVIGLAASGVLSILVSSLTGVGVLLLTRNLDLTAVYKKINWQIIFLLAGMIPLGLAMHNTEADMWISGHLIEILGEQTKTVVIGTLFLVTMLMSGIVSNNATAIIMTPIAIALAQGLSMDYKAFILAVMFAANFSFFTPVGYQTNTLIYGIGNYKFRHFFVIGGILSLILWVLATLLLTRFF